MHKTTVALLIVIVVVIVGALLLISRSGGSLFPSGVGDGDNGDSGDTANLVTKEALISGIDILFVESRPVQVRVIARGNLADSCTEIGDISTSRNNDTFAITVMTKRPKDLVCAQVVSPFEEAVDLDVEGITVGTYTVDVNGVTDTFIVDTDNVLP